MRTQLSPELSVRCPVAPLSNAFSNVDLHQFCLIPLPNRLLSYNTNRDFYSVLAAGPELGYRLSAAWKLLATSRQDA